MTAHHHHKIPKLSWVALLSGLLIAVPAMAEGTEAYGEETSYSFARVVEGNATLLEVGGDRDTLEVHQPILVGDQLWVPHGSRLEMVLADRSLLRIQGESQAVFENIAYSADTGDRTTVLGISEGKMQMIVPEDALGDALPQIQTPDGTIYIHREGSFRLSVGNGWTELVVREGLAEMVTERSSLLVHPGEAGWFEGGTRPRSEVRLAGYRDELERWGERLSEEARLASVPYVDPSLSYAAAPLADHGAWVEVSGRRAWRPRVEVSWRPYSYGYWRHTPVGLTWVSYDPWGYVTHHYGSWDYSSGYGWVWYPGRVYAPARVTWYWGPSYVGWCPTGYYAHHYRYRHTGFGLHFGTYGWARGSWDYYSHWTFSLSLDFGRRHYRDRSYRRGYRDGYRDGYDHGHYGHHWSASDLSRDRREIDRGVITTDPGRERRTAGERYENLERRLTEVNRVKGSEAPDVTDFVARRTLDGSVATAVLTKPTADRSSSSKPTLSARGDWSTGAKPLPNLAGPTVRNPADKPLPSTSASKPAYRDKPTVDSRKPTTITRAPATISRKPLNDRSTTPRPVVIERRTSKPTTTRPEASKPSSRTTSPRVTRPDYSKPTTTRPEASKPPTRVTRPDYSKPIPRTTTPRTTRPSTTKPPTRVTRPDYSKPTPRTTTPRTTTPRTTTPRTTRPSTSKPSTRVTRPDYSKPTPRTTTPRTTRPSTSKPSTRVTRPSTSKPPTRVTRPSTSKPSTRVTRPSTSKPSTRVTRPSTSKPSTRVTSPSSRSRPQASRPAPSRPAPRATKPAPSKPKASSSSRSSGSRNASKPAKSKKNKND